MYGESPAALMASTATLAVIFSLGAWYSIVFRKKLALLAGLGQKLLSPPWLRVGVSRQFVEVVYLILGIGCGVLAVVFWAALLTQAGLALRGELRPEDPGTRGAGTVVLFGLIALALGVGAYVWARYRRRSG